MCMPSQDQGDVGGNAGNNIRTVAEKDSGAGMVPHRLHRYLKIVVSSERVVGTAKIERANAHGIVFQQVNVCRIQSGVNVREAAPMIMIAVNGEDAEARFQLREGGYCLNSAISLGRRSFVADEVPTDEDEVGM